MTRSPDLHLRRGGHARLPVRAMIPPYRRLPRPPAESSALPTGPASQVGMGHAGGPATEPKPCRRRSHHKAFLLLLALVTVAFFWVLLPVLRRGVLGGDPGDRLPAAAPRPGAALRRPAQPGRAAERARLHRHRDHPGRDHPVVAGRRGLAAGGAGAGRRARRPGDPRRPRGGDAALGAAVARALRHR